MHFLLGLLAVASFAYAEPIPSNISPAYGYITKYGIPQAERIRKAEEETLNSRIIGGVPVGNAQYPFQAGLLGEVVGMQDIVTVCGASLISQERAITAAHCWNDGTHQVWRFTVVLGSTFLFSGGTRVQTSAIAVHPNFNIFLARNDVAVLYIPTVQFSASIGPLALPSGSALFENYADESAIAIGFGLTAQDGSISGGLNHVRLNVIENNVCRLAFTIILQSSNICTSGLRGSICQGDSGGPLVTTRNNQYILIGVSSFVSPLGCESGLPAVYARATSFMNFFNTHL